MAANFFDVLNSPAFETVSQSSHRKCMKTTENKGFLTSPNAMGRSVAVKLPVAFQKANKINGFEHIFYGTALKYCFGLKVVTPTQLAPPPT